MQIPLLTWGPSESPADLTGLSHPGGGEQTQEAIAFSALLLAAQAHLCGMTGAPESTDAPSAQSPEGNRDEDEPGDGETPTAGLAAGAAALPVYPDLPLTKISDAPASAAAPIEPAAIVIAEHDPAAQSAPQHVPAGAQTAPSPSPYESARSANAPHSTDTVDLQQAERGQADARAARTPDGSAGAAPIKDAAEVPGSSDIATSTPAKSAPVPRGEPSHREADTAAPQVEADTPAVVRGERWEQAAAAAQADEGPDISGESAAGKGDEAPGRKGSTAEPLSFEQSLSPAMREAAAPEANPADKLFVRHEPIVEQILYKLDFQSLKRGGTLRIALEPDTLGGVTIRLEASQEGVLVRIEADSAQVREALDSQLGQLTASLRDSGVPAQAVRVQPGDAHEPAAGMQAETLLSGGQGRQPGSAHPKDRLRSPETAADTALQPEIPAARRVPGINLYA